MGSCELNLTTSLLFIQYKTGYYFILENGNYLTAYYKQGYYGTKEIELVCRFNKNKKFEYSFNNSNRKELLTIK